MRATVTITMGKSRVDMTLYSGTGQVFIQKDGHTQQLDINSNHEHTLFRLLAKSPMEYLLETTKVIANTPGSFQKKVLQ